MSDYYQLDHASEFHVWDMESFEEIDSKARFKSSWMSAYIKPGMKVLDIGCGPGYTTKILYDNGIEVLGIDLNESSIHKAKVQGLPVELADARAFIMERGKEFDVFIMNDFIEHVPLAVAYDIVKAISLMDNAIIYLCTPNLNSLMGFKFWFHMPTHINAMHPYVIRKMLHNLGYTTLKEWSEYGELPGKGWKLWLRKKIVRTLFGTQAELFLEGANINFIAEIKSGR